MASLSPESQSISSDASQTAKKLQFRLQSHQKDYSKDEMIIYQRTGELKLKKGDVIEIYSDEDKYSRLLMQVNDFDTEMAEPLNKNENRISIESSIIATFHLKVYNEVNVNIVDPNDTILDSIELVFKDQYIARSDMWRIKRHVCNTCVYLNKKIDFINIRCQVFEMWSQGERMASGYVNNDTKVVFRSASSMVYLFIQMSCEMWEYDINGDLYFEKAVTGLLCDLFDKWKRFGCSHDVTIVLFSRNFYEAKSIDEFPEKMKEVLQTDYMGRFYEDFYRVAVQNDRHEDWTPILSLLRKLFINYEDEVIRYHEKYGLNVPKAYNSTSSQGNFLEVLNISLNVFEKHHLYRSFDRTGQLSVVISPGVGVFEVDLDLTNTTKQRIIDNGIGSDLVCLGEQPLHAVPLFKFNAKLPKKNDTQYNMPHWINLSFYSSTTSVSYNNFVLRIKLPPFLTKTNKSTKRSNHSRLHRCPSRDSPNCQIIPSLIDYDDYDEQIFRECSSTSPPAMTSNANTCQPSMRLKTAFTHKLMDNTIQVNKTIPETGFRGDSNYSNFNACRSLKTELIEISRSRHLSPTHANMPLMSTSVENKSFKDFKSKAESKDDLIVNGYNNNFNNELSKSKALINPFDPSHVTIKLTSNRRRWTHVFPLGPTGIFMQQHHYQAVPQNTASTVLPSRVCADASYSIDSKDSPDSQAGRKISVAQITSNEWLTSERKLSNANANNNVAIVSPIDNSKSNKRLSSNNIINNNVTNNNNHSSNESTKSADKKRELSVWGATGEQEWTPAITTGVDWKSMVMPACLPITTDFLPDKRTLEQDYVTYQYNLLPEDQNCDFAQQQCYSREENKNYSPFNTYQVYLELICQRLQQGFQMILLTNSRFRDNVLEECDRYEYAMSIGRIYHEIKLSSRTIYVINYHPRHPYPVIKIHYCYRFRAPDNEKYGVSWIDFVSEKLEGYKWNYLDNYICMRGDYEYQLDDTFKCWKFRILMLPTMQSITKAIIDKYISGEDGFSCDNYHSFTKEDNIQLQDGFIKFLEVINRMRRPIIKGKANTKADIRKSMSAQKVNRRFSVAVGHNISNTSNTQTTRLSQPTESIKNDICDSSIFKESMEHSLLINNPFKPSLFKMNSKDKPLNYDETDGNSISVNKQPLNEVELHQSDDIIEDHDTPKRLTKDSPHSEIIDALKDENSLNYLSKQSGLPQWTFISAEAVIWAKNNIEQVYTESQAIDIFQSLQKDGLICHASGNKNHPFIHGFYLYCIIDPKNSNIPENDFRMFEREWMEVMIIPQNNIDNNLCEWYSEANSEELISSNTPEVQDFTFKKTRLDLEDGSKNGRVEWVDVKYHSVYDPEQAFEVQIEWMVSTGNTISEIVTGWNRKTGSTGLHLVPIPYDPFALPYSSQSDPLRGPIYISLNTECLPHIKTPILKAECISFQEKILVKFGFIPFHDLTNDSPCQYVHVSGSIFVMILGKISPPHHKSVRKRGKLLKEENESSRNIDELSKYITRHFSGVKQSEDTRIDSKIGFIWCWNYMITKRWKTGVTGDESSMRKIYQDFRSFCANKNDRLETFYNENFNEQIPPINEEAVDNNGS